MQGLLQIHFTSHTSPVQKFDTLQGSIYIASKENEGDQ